MDLQKLIGRYQRSINTIYRSVNNMIKSRMHSDITADQFSILQFIYQQTECTSTQIAQSFGIGKSSVTASVNRLFEKDYIARNRDEADRRIVYLSLTNVGKEVVTETQQEIYKIIGEQLNHFDPLEIENFIYALEKLSHLLENRDEHTEE